MIIKLVCAAVGSLGFGMYVNSKNNKLFSIAISGFLNYFSYYATYKMTGSVFTASTVCALVTFVYSNIMAYVEKCPSTVFILTGLIPIVPGASLFYMMQNLVLSNKALFIKYGIEASWTVIGIAFGITLASVILKIIRKSKNA